MRIKVQCDHLEVGTSAAAVTAAWSPWLDGKTLSYVAFACGGRTIHCHKYLLAAQSGIFRKMLAFRENEIAVSGFEPDVVEILVNYAYTGDAPEESVTWELFEAAARYGMVGLRDACLRSLPGRISVENCARTLTMASEHELEDVFEVAADFFRKNTKEVVRTEGWSRAVTNSVLLRKIMEKVGTQA
jgi:hypothetical protein